MQLDEITYKVNGAIFEVSRQLGPGFLEKVYERALLFELKSRGLKAEGQKAITVKYKGMAIGDYFADILVEDTVILEIKTVNRLEKIHKAQLLNYLKATGKTIGLLVNFKHQKAEIKRLVMDHADVRSGVTKEQVQR